MTGVEPAHGRWCHCGVIWLHGEPEWHSGQLHDVHRCGAL